MKIDFKGEFAKILSGLIKKDYQKIYSLIEIPPDEKMGDLSFPCFVLVKEYKKSPQNIAEDLKNKFSFKKSSYFYKIEAVDGYLNIFINKELYIKNVLENFEDSLQFEQERQKVIIEYMNANPNKPLHLGQARNICIGDSLVRVFRFLGYNVGAVNYSDDSGVNVAYNLVAHLNYKVPWEKDGLKFDHYCGKVYTDSLLLKEKEPEFEKRLKLVLREIENKKSKIAQQQKKYAMQCMLAQMATCWRMNSYFNLNNWETDILYLDLLKDTLEKIKKIKQVKFIKEGKYKNCLVFDLTGIEKFRGLKDKICVLIKSDGVATYLAKDIAYALWKLGYFQKTFYYESLAKQPNNTILWSTTSEVQKKCKNLASQEPCNFCEAKIGKQDKDFGNYDLSIVVIDKRQEFLQEVLITVLKEAKIIKGKEENFFAGKNKISKKQKQYFHLSYGMVYLTPETLMNCGYSLTVEEKRKKQLPFSSRKGWTVTIDEALDQLENIAYKETKKRNINQSELWIKKTSQKIAVAGLRFWLSKTDKKRDLIFDIKKSLRLDGSSGTYIQYSYVRIINILKKIQEEKISIRDSKIEISLANYQLLKEPNEFQLVKKIDLFRDIIEKTKIEMSPHLLTNYLLELCQIFNQYYAKTSIIKSEKNLKKARIDLIQKVLIVLKIGLNLLGIDELEKM